MSRESRLYEVLNSTKSNKIPKDFYDFLLFKVNYHINLKIDEGRLTDGKGNFERLKSFILNRTHVKKVIMNIPYNASNRSMADYLKSELKVLEYNANLKTYWYLDKVNTTYKINTSDINLLIKIIRDIISADFFLITKLTKYIKNVATLCNALNLPIYWSLPTGLNIYQSYLKSSITVAPFSYNKIKPNLKVVDKDL